MRCKKTQGTGIVSHTFPPVTTHRLQTALLLLPLKIPTLSRTSTLAPRVLSSIIPESHKALYAVSSAWWHARCDAFAVPSICTDAPVPPPICMSYPWVPLSPLLFTKSKVPTNFQLPESIPAGLLIDTFSTNEKSCPQVTEAHGMAPPRAGIAWGGKSTGLWAVRQDTLSSLPSLKGRTSHLNAHRE